MAWQQSQLLWHAGIRGPGPGAGEGLLGPLHPRHDREGHPRHARRAKRHRRQSLFQAQVS